MCVADPQIVCHCKETMTSFRFNALTMMLKYVYSFQFYALQAAQETLVHQVRVEGLESVGDPDHPEPAGPLGRLDGPDREVLLENEERVAKTDL